MIDLNIKFWFLCYLFLFSNITLTYSDVEFFVKGHVTCVTAPRYKEHPETYDFEVNVKNNSYFIKLIPTGLGPNKGICPDYEIIASDEVRWFELDSTEKYQSTNSIHCRNKGSATMGLGIFPLEADPRLRTLWFIYASSDYFLTNKGTQYFTMEPSAQFMETGKFFTSEGELKLSQHTPCLPDRLTVNCSQMHVVRWTNFDGLSLPIEAVYSYSTKPIPINEDHPTNTIRQMTFIATSFSKNVTKKSFIPELPNPTFISDIRFKGESKPVVLYATTNQWPSDEQAVHAYSNNVAHGIFSNPEMKKEFFQNKHSIVRKREQFLVITFVGITILPLLIILIKKRGENKNTK